VTTPDPRWTPPEHLRDLIAEATEQHHIEAGETDAMGNNPCVCGQWWDAAGDNPGWDQHMADVALVALHRAGLLVTPQIAAVVEATRHHIALIDGRIRTSSFGAYDEALDAVHSALAAVDALEARMTGAGA